MASSPPGAAPVPSGDPGSVGEPPPAGERKNLVHGGNEAFTCLRCGASVRPLQNGSVRNHCPECLWSLHLDQVPGDRADRCGSLMEPVGLEGSPSAGFTIVLRCTGCGAVRRNRASEDDPAQPDRWEALTELSTRAKYAPPRRRFRS